MLETQLEFIRQFQQLLGLAWEPFFAALSFLGEEQFFLVALPLLFWSVDYRLGARIAYLYIVSSALNTGLKALFAEPRPYDLDPSVGLSESPGGGLPSGHAQAGLLIWGYLAARVRGLGAWVGAALLIFLIGLSRVFLGVHFPTDVLGGWLIGAALLFGYLRAGSTVERSLAQLGFGYQLALSIGLPLLLAAIEPNDEVIAAMGVFGGLSLGLALSARYLGFSAAGTLAQRGARYLVGVIVVIGLFFGLRSLFPAEGEALYAAFRYLRYLAVGLWVALGAPWAFIRLGLAGSSRTNAGTGE